MWIALAVVLNITALVFLVSTFRPQIEAALKSVGIVASGIAVIFAVVAVVGFVVTWAALWIVMPFIIYYGFRDLNRKAEVMEDQIRKCGHRLDEIAEQGRETGERR
jgi:hypothetical protein